MTIITCDMTIIKETGQLILTIPFKFIGIYQPELGPTEIDIQNVK